MGVVHGKAFLQGHRSRGWALCRARVPPRVWHVECQVLAGIHAIHDLNTPIASRILLLGAGAFSTPRKGEVSWQILCMKRPKQAGEKNSARDLRHGVKAMRRMNDPHAQRCW